MSILMPFGALTDWKLDGTGQRRVSPGSFQKGSEFGKGLKSNGISQLAATFLLLINSISTFNNYGTSKKARLEGSRLFEHFFVYILHLQVDLLFAQVYTVRVATIYNFVI